MIDYLLGAGATVFFFAAHYLTVKTGASVAASEEPEAREFEVEPTPPAQGAYRTAGTLTPESCPEPVDPALPTVSTECPACGVDLEKPVCAGGHMSKGQMGRSCEASDCGRITNDLKLELKFCSSCKAHPEPHLHQSCDHCGWRGISRTQRKIQACTE